MERLHLPRPERMTPLRFLHDLIERARAQRRHIVLPEGTDVRILRAAEILHRRDVCDLTLLGRESDVRELAATQGIDLSGINIVDPATSELRQEFAEKYAELRAHKGVDLAKALEIMQDGSYFGTMMVQLGVVDGMVSGAAHTTAHTIRPGAGVREDPRRRQDRLLGVPDADAGPRAGLRRLRREPGPQRRAAGGHRPGLGRDGRAVRRGAAGGHAVLLHRRLRLRRGRGRSPAGHRTGAGSAARTSPSRAPSSTTPPWTPPSPSPRCRARPWPGRRPCSSSRT